MKCNATLETLSRTDKVVAKIRCTSEGDHPGHFHGAAIPDGVTVTRDGDRLLRADVTVLTCQKHTDAAFAPHYAQGVAWNDSVEGATPHRDPMDELIAVSEQAGLYDDPCPDCDGGRVRCKADCIDRHPCPSCTGTAPTVTDADLNELSDRIENLEQGIWRLHGLPNVREEPGGEHVNAIRYCGECKREWPCPTVKLNTEAWQAAARARQEDP